MLSSVGTYSVQGQLGASAWAETHVATTDDQPPVALKTFDDPGEDAWKELERTREALAKVPEHLVLPIVALGKDDDAHLAFIATPLSETPSLADLVEIHALSSREAVTLVKNLGIALDRASSERLVHLALKPSNVFVGPPPTYAVRVVDFGADALRRAKKEAGALVWLAPEQIDAPNAADARADVFSAALLAFFAMTGKSYWTSEGADALVREMRGERTAPSARAKAIGAAIPSRLDPVLLRALGPLDERFESVRAFAEALEAALAEPSRPSIPEERSSERHVKATLKLEKFRMPTLENAAPSGTERAAPPPLPQRTAKMPAARIPEPPPSASASVPATPVAVEPPPVPRRRSIYIPQRVLVVLAIAVTALTLGVTIAAVAKIRSTPLPAPDAGAAVASAAPPGPPTEVVVPPPPPPPEPTASPPEPLGAHESELEVVCTPACDKVLVDGKAMSTYPTPMHLPPGRHGVGVTRTGYGGQYKLVFLKGGERQTVSFTLSLAPKK